MTKYQEYFDTKFEELKKTMATVADSDIRNIRKCECQIFDRKISNAKFAKL